jgi:hypothetical protein
MTSEPSVLFTWRDAIKSPVGGPQTVRLPVKSRNGGPSARTVSGASQRQVALNLSTHMDRQAGSCYPSVEQQAAETQLHERTVQWALRALEKGGWLEVRLGGTFNGRKVANTYLGKVPTGGTAPPVAHLSTGGTAPPSDGWPDATGGLWPPDGWPDATLGLHGFVHKNKGLTRVHDDQDRQDELAAALAEEAVAAKAALGNLSTMFGRHVDRPDVERAVRELR